MRSILSNVLITFHEIFVELKSRVGIASNPQTQFRVELLRAGRTTPRTGSVKSFRTFDLG